MTGNNYLIDSSAWVEYFDGTPLGAHLKRILDDPHNTSFVCGNVICEVMSKLVRRGFGPEEYFQIIRSRTKFIEDSALDYMNAGIRHAVLKKSEERISYTDALLIVLSETRKLKIVSKDAHLKGNNTLFLR